MVPSIQTPQKYHSFYFKKRREEEKMIDIKLIRENRELVKENIKKKFQDEKLPLVDEVYELDIKYRECKTKADNLKSEKNKLS